MTLPHLHLLPGLHGNPELYAPFLEEMGDRPVSTTHYPEDDAPTTKSVLGVISRTVPQDREYVLVAESFSGLFATIFAAQRPPNLAGLVLVNTFLQLPFGPVMYLVTKLRIKMPWFMASGLLLDETADEEFSELTRRLVWEVPSRLIAARFALLYRSDARGFATRVTTPTLVLHGERDYFVPREHSLQIERHIPGSERREIPGPHLLLQSYPQESLEVIQNWWQERGAAATRPAP
ncbi:MAG: alpha/beta hydrolase [Planctomycetales bacterium]|nr:alpha/beta hydrolase [Planctomycetales bacterium]